MCPEGPKIAKIHWILACPVLILSKKSFFQQKVAFFDKNGPFREEKWPTQRTKMACAEGKNGLSKTSYARGGLCMCRKKPLPRTVKLSIYGHTFLVHNLVIFGPISKFFILGCSGDQYLSDEPLFGRFWGKINIGLRRRPVTGVPVARSPRGAETPKLDQKFPLWSC